MMFNLLKLLIKLKEYLFWPKTQKKTSKKQNKTRFILFTLQCPQRR